MNRRKWSGLNRKRQARRRQTPQWLVIFIVFIVFAVLKISGGDTFESPGGSPDQVNNIPAATAEYDWAVYFIDVGQADSILIKAKDQAMLIDAGNNDDGELVTGFIKDLGIDTLEYIVATHPHEDHIGGMDTVINTFEIKKIIMPKVEHSTKTYEDMLEAVLNNGLKITSPVPGTRFDIGEGEFTILAPNRSRYDDINDYSVVIKLQYKNTAFLFTGDAGIESETEMLDKGYDLKADLLKVGHHGSRYSTSEEFLNAVQPETAVISGAKDNMYGHPSPETIDRLRQAGVRVYRTDEAGTIAAVSDGEKIEIHSRKGD
jgi:competence protein ComEC